MNKGLLIGAGLLAIMFLGGKKTPKATKSPMDEFEPEPEVDEVPEEDTIPKDSDKFLTLTKSRKEIVNDFIKNLPLENKTIVDPYGNYFKWKDDLMNATTNSYYDWLANQVYWAITHAEHTTDLYSPVDENDSKKLQTNINYSATYPFLLRKGEKGTMTLTKQGAAVIIENLDETDAQAKKRLAPGIALWVDINKYIKKNLPPSSCPDGVVCK